MYRAAILKEKKKKNRPPPSYFSKKQDAKHVLFFLALLPSYLIRQRRLREGDIIDDDQEDEYYIQRLDAGLFSLQLLDYIILELCCNSGVSSIKSRVLQLLNMRGGTITDIRNVVRGNRKKSLENTKLLLNFYSSWYCTVKPVYNDHPRETQKVAFVDGFFSTWFNEKPFSRETTNVAFVDRWSLKQVWLYIISLFCEWWGIRKI